MVLSHSFRFLNVHVGQYKLPSGLESSRKLLYWIIQRKSPWSFWIKVSQASWGQSVDLQGVLNYSGDRNPGNPREEKESGLRNWSHSAILVWDTALISYAVLMLSGYYRQFCMALRQSVWWSAFSLFSVLLGLCSIKVSYPQGKPGFPDGSVSRPVMMLGTWILPSFHLWGGQKPT